MNAITVLEVDSSALSSIVAFTGRLACMTRAEAFEVVRSHGGTPSESVTRQTNVLIVGELGWPLLDDGRPSNKLSRAGSYGVPVVSERRFLEWIGKAVPDSLHRTYSAEQIAALSKLSNTRVDDLVRCGLLDPRGGLFGFRDLASARQISKLFAHGIVLSEIIRSVKEVREWLPEAESPVLANRTAWRAGIGPSVMLRGVTASSQLGIYADGAQTLQIVSTRVSLNGNLTEVRLPVSLSAEKSFAFGGGAIVSRRRDALERLVASIHVVDDFAINFGLSSHRSAWPSDRPSDDFRANETLFTLGGQYTLTW